MQRALCALIGAVVPVGPGWRARCSPAASVIDADTIEIHGTRTRLSGKIIWWIGGRCRTIVLLCRVAFGLALAEGKAASTCREAVVMWCGGCVRVDGDHDDIPCENVCPSR